jgi:hypothetical protein
MEKILKTTLTCRICRFVKETKDTVDEKTITCMAYSIQGVKEIRNFSERKCKIEDAERKFFSLDKAMHYNFRNGACGKSYWCFMNLKNMHTC